MKYILEYNEFINKSLEESKSEKELMKIAKGYEKELKQLKKNPEDNEHKIAAKEEQIRRVATAIRNTRADELNEAQKYDIAAALRKVRDFNRGNYGGVEDSGDTVLAADIIKDLGYKATKKNVANTVDHLIASMNDREKIPEDKGVIVDLYSILEGALNEGKRHNFKFSGSGDVPTIEVATEGDIVYIEQAAKLIDPRNKWTNVFTVSIPKKDIPELAKLMEVAKRINVGMWDDAEWFEDVGEIGHVIDIYVSFGSVMLRAADKKSNNSLHVHSIYVNKEDVEAFVKKLKMIK